MPSYYKLPSGLWRAQVNRKGIRKSASFPSKGAAQAWGNRVEGDILAGDRGEIPNLTVRDLLKRYREEIVPRKKGARFEALRLEAVERSRLGSVRLRVLDSPHVSAWQVERLKAVSEGSVRRERNILNNVFNIAVIEWKWLRKNPFGEHGKAVRRPKDSRPKSRVATQAEIDQLLVCASGHLKRAIVVALETGMRASEIASQPSINGRVATLVDTKNGEVREVPLSPKAVEQFREGINLTAGSISNLFRELTAKLGFGDLTFHCLRRTAATRLSKKLTLFELCTIMGWKDPRIPLKHYYSAKAEDIADKL